MSASTTDLFTKVGLPGSATTLESPGYTIGDVTINLAATTNWPTDTLICFAIDRAEIINGETVRIAGTYNEFSGIVTGAGVIESLVHEFGPAQDYAAGALTRVYIPVSSTRENKMVEGLEVEHNKNGTHNTALFNKIYPVGSVYVNASSSTNPGTLLGFGTWAAFGAGRVLVGLDATQTEFDTIGETGGEKTHQLTISEMPAHTHTYKRPLNTVDSDRGTNPSVYSIDNDENPNTGSTGGDAAHNNLQPYITVYMWKRTA